MASTASPSLKLELMATGDQSGTWGDTTNTNLGTLLEQAITGYVAIAKVGTGDYTLSNTDYAANENRNALIEFTGTPGGAFNVVVPLAEKLWVFKNSTDGAMTVKGASGTTTTVAVGASAWLFCDGTDVRDALGYYFGSTITAFSPATNNTQALGTTALQWADLFLAAGGVINFDNGDVTITEGPNTLAFAGAASGYSFSHVVTPAANDGAALGTTSLQWSDLFLASGGVLNFANGNWEATHTSGILTVGTGDLRVTTAGTNTASVVTVGGTQTLTGKTLTTPAFSGTPTGLDASTTAKGISEFSTADEFRAGTDTTRSLVVDQVWASAAEVTLSDAATIAVNMATFFNATVTLGGNRTLGQPSNTKVGQSGVIRVVQPGSGGPYTLAYHADWEFAGGTAPVLSTAANAQDLLFYQVIGPNRIFASLVKAVA
jgi:hypothetical protein